MTDLSPAAQAVFDAWVYPARLPVDSVGKGARTALVQALRAVADQVVPSEQSTHRPDGPLVTGDMLWDDATAATLRFRLLTIAAELEGAGD